MDGDGAVGDGEFDDRGTHPHVEGGADRADDRRSCFDVERAFGVTGDIERGFALQDTHFAAIIGEADFGFAVAVEVQGRSIFQRDVADLADAGLETLHPAERADGDDGGDDEEHDRDGGGDHDVARQAALLFFADDLRQRGQGDFGGGAFQSLGRFPCCFGTGERNGVAGVSLYPCANFGFVLRAGIAVKPGQQARCFRFDRGPGPAA